MHISKELPQFSKQKALILVTSLHDVHAYKAEDGECTLLQKKSVKETEYSDNEGHFERSSNGATHGSGSVLEENTQEERNKLQKVIEEVIDPIEIKEYDHLFLFTPGYLKNITSEPLEKLQSSYITIEGNYTKHSLPELLEIIEKQS